MVDKSAVNRWAREREYSQDCRHMLKYGALDISKHLDNDSTGAFTHAQRGFS